MYDASLCVYSLPGIRYWREGEVYSFFLWGVTQSLEQQLVNVTKTPDEEERCTHVCLFFSAPHSMNGYSSAMTWHAVTFAYDTVLEVQSYHKKHCACCVPYKYRVKSFLHPVPCNPVIYQSRPVQSRGISIPSRAIPWYLDPVPCNPVISRSRQNCPVQSRDGSIPSCTVPCLKYPFLSRPGESRDISIPRDPVPKRKFGPEESPEQNKYFFPAFPMATVREYLHPISFLNSLERKLCNIAFPLSSV